MLPSTWVNNPTLSARRGYYVVEQASCLFDQPDTDKKRCRPSLRMVDLRILKYPLSTPLNKFEGATRRLV